MNNYEKVAVFPWTVEYEVREKGAIGNYQRKDIRVIAETKEEAGREALKIIHRNYPNPSQKRVLFSLSGQETSQWHH